jgi:predicted O-methyltransferase YrrM
MYSPVRLAWKYLHYYFTAANGKGHGIHSPFVFDFVTRVLNDRGPYPAWTAIEELRGRLLRDNRLVGIEDMGAGSAYAGEAAVAGTSEIAAEAADAGEGTTDAGDERSAGGETSSAVAAVRMRKIADIARRAAKPRRLGQLLFRIAHHYQPGTVLELGTSLGLSTAYLATGVPGAHVISIEGSGSIREAAAENLRSLGLAPELVQGNFDEVLEPLLSRIGPVGLAFVDGNHRYEPTLRYFHSLMVHMSVPAVLIFDDIHWSADMERAWAEIRGDSRVYMTIDLFFIGLVFLREEFKVKQDFTIRF